MKTGFLILLLGLILSGALSAQVGTIQKSKKPVKATTIDMKSQSSTGAKEATHLRTEMPDTKAAQIGNKLEQLAANPGNPAYTTGNGVVLDPLNIQDSASKSCLYLSGIAYGPFEYEQIKTRTSIPFTIFVGSYPNGEITAEFKDLPTSPHMYLLTLGSTADVTNTKITIYGSRSDPGTTFDLEKLVTITESSEIRLLFTFNSILDNQFSLTVKVDFTYPEVNKEIFFNYLQIKQLD